MKLETRYLDGTYATNNPNWDRFDSPWKANLVKNILINNKIFPLSICEVGCGSGDILRSLKKYYPHTSFTGYDISPQASVYWDEIECDNNDGLISYYLGDFFELNSNQYDVLLLIDVFEHVRDPYTFLEDAHSSAKKFVFHIPLDLSSFSIARKSPLINVRRKVGHLHFYTKDLALETLTDCGYKIIDYCYTGSSITGPNRSFKTKVASFVRIILSLINKDWAVRILGGETLLVLAE